MKRRLFLALAAFVCLALFLVARQAASWRPQVLGNIAAATNVSLSPDRRIVLVTSGATNESTFFAADTGRLLRELPRARVYAFSPNSQMIAVVNDNQGQTPNKKGITYTPGARFLDVKTGRTVRVLRAPDQLTENWTSDASFSPDSKKFFIVTPRSFYEFDAATGQLLHRTVPQTAFDPTLDNAHKHKISPDARRVIAFGKSARIYDIRTGTLLHSLRVSGYHGEFVGWSPDGTLYWQTDAFLVHFWNAQSGKLVAERQWFGSMSHFTSCPIPKPSPLPKEIGSNCAMFSPAKPSKRFPARAPNRLQSRPMAHSPCRSKMGSCCAGA